MKYGAKLFLFTACIILCLSMLSCSEKTKESQENKGARDTFLANEKASQQIAKSRDTVAKFDPKKELSFNVLGNTIDEMHLSQSMLYAPANTRIKLSINNFTKGKDTKFNFILTKPGKLHEAVVTSMAAGIAKNLIPLDTSTYYMATPIIEPGVPLTVNFTTPAKGEYTFVCTYANMHNRLKGKLILQ